MSGHDDRLVSVFKTDDPGLLPLATMALEAEGIACFVRHAGKADSLAWLMSQTPTNRPTVHEIIVSPDEAERARLVLDDLATAPVRSADPAFEALSEGDLPAISLEDAATGLAIGTITEAQLQELASRIAETGPQTFTIGPAALADLDEAGADARLVALLRRAIGDRSADLAIRWTVR